MTRAYTLVLATLGFWVPQMAAAQEAPAPPAPYSLPWLLRGAVPGNVVRFDETIAFFENPTTHASGTTDMTCLLVTRKLTPNVMIVGRESWINNSPPAPTLSGTAFSNPALGVVYGRTFSEGWRWAGLLAVALPIGSGGGNTPDPSTAAAIASGAAARSIMENPMFAVNYFGVVEGLDVARITPDLTLQAEVSFSQLARVRGPETQDSTRVNFTSGVHIGHFFSPTVSLGAELRYQRWLSDAAPVKKDPTAREQLTVAAGPRLHFKLGPHSWIRPGVSYTTALDDPMSRSSYHILQIDAPISF